jgi:hypothetical protein
VQFKLHHYQKSHTQIVLTTAPFGLDFQKAMVKSEQTGLTVHE